jgi:tetratricopeptide (TPR) repeat protein
MKSTDILFAQERDDSMLGELKAKVLQDAEDYYQRLVRFTEQGDYEAAVDLLTKLILLKEFEAASLSGYGVCAALYRKLADMYQLLGNTAEELKTIERYFLQITDKLNVNMDLAHRFLLLAEREGYQIPDDIMGVIRKNIAAGTEDEG